MELVDSAWSKVDEGFSLMDVLLAPASAGWREGRLGETVLGLGGTAAAEELKLLAPPLLFCCLSL